MEESEHKSFFRTHRVLFSVLPLLMLSAGVFYHISKHKPGGSTGRPPQNVGFGRPAPAASSVLSPAAEEAKSIAALNIQGSAEFKSQATRALKLIWLADRDAFLFIKRYIFVIRNEDKTGFYMDNGQPVAAVSKAHAFRSLTWCAGIIAHQAFHSYAAFSSKKKKTARVPPPGSAPAPLRPATPRNFDFTSLNSILDLEAKASRFQAETLEKTGASRREKNDVAKRKPRDFTTAHDGSYQLVIKP